MTAWVMHSPQNNDKTKAPAKMCGILSQEMYEILSQEICEILSQKISNPFIRFDFCRKCEWPIQKASKYICPRCGIIIPRITHYETIKIRFEKAVDPKYFRGMLYWLLFSEIETNSNRDYILMNMGSYESTFIWFVPNIINTNNSVFNDLALFASQILVSMKNYLWIMIGFFMIDCGVTGTCTGDAREKLQSIVKILNEVVDQVDYYTTYEEAMTELYKYDYKESGPPFEPLFTPYDKTRECRYLTAVWLTIQEKGYSVDDYCPHRRITI